MISDTLSKNFPVEVKVVGFPKCLCGGDFQVYDLLNGKDQLQATAAICRTCSECFVDDDAWQLRKRLPKCQELRHKHNSSYKYSL